MARNKSFTHLYLFSYIQVDGTPCQLKTVNVGKLEGADTSGNTDNNNVQQDQNTTSGVVARRKRRETVFAGADYTRPPILVCMTSIPYCIWH